MRRAALVLAALLLAAPSLAATYWVAPTARGNGSGQPDSSNATTLGWFNTNAVAGDVARMLAGSYASQIAPANSGTGYASRITYRGADLAAPGVTLVAGLVLSARSHVSVKGISWAAAPALGGYRDSVAYCQQTAGVWQTTRSDSDNVWQNFTYTGPHVEFAGGNVYSDPAEISFRDTLRDCSWSITYNYDASQAALRWAAIHGWVIERNRFTVMVRDGSNHGVFKVYKQRASQVTDCSFDFSSTRNNTSCDECAWTYFRDSTCFNLWTRDTLSWGEFTNTVPAVLFSASGTQQHSVRSNHYDQCVFRYSPATSGYGHFIYYYDTVDSDSLTNCVIVSNSVTPLALSRENSGLAFRGPLYLSHNTIARLGAGNALSINSAYDQTLTLDKNIFYLGGSTATRTLRTAYQTTSTLQSHITSDYNLFYDVDGDSAVYSSTDGVYRGPATLCSSFTDDCHSKMANPALTSTGSVAGFDAHLTAGSPALFSGDGYVGAYNYGVATTHTITASAGNHGTVTPSGAVSVADAGSRSFTITPEVGCSISDVLVDDVSVGAVTDYTFSNVTEDHTISATFSVNTYGLYSQAYPHGTITPEGTTTVSYGATQTFEIVPDATYSVLDVVVDGASVGAVGTYTFYGIAEPHSIDAYFKPTSSYTIIASAGSGGSIDPAGATAVVSGGSQEYTITASSGYHVANVLVDGVSVGAVTSYTFTNVTDDHTIVASFALDAATIQLLSSSGGSVWPPGPIAVAGGEKLYFNIVPDPFRRLVALYINGIDVGPHNCYTLSDITGNVTMYATFTSYDIHGGVRRGGRR